MRREQPTDVDLFSQRFSYPSIFRRGKLKKLFAKVNKRSLDILEDYVKYATRFQVVLQKNRDSFRVIPIAPFKSKYRAIILHGHLASADEQVRLEEEPMFEDLYADDNLSVPHKVAMLPAEKLASRQGV